jgi:hypothetical protein
MFWSRNWSHVGTFGGFFADRKDAAWEIETRRARNGVASDGHPYRGVGLECRRMQVRWPEGRNRPSAGGMK